MAIMVQALSIHAPTAALLVGGLTGSVVSLHKRAVNLLFGDDLVTAVAPEWGNGPGNLVCRCERPFTALGWEQGSRVTVAGGLILGPGGHTLTWGDAARWAPPPPPDLATVIGTALLRANREALAAALARHGDHAGLLPAALAAAASPDSTSPDSALPDSTSPDSTLPDSASLTPLARFALPRLAALLAGAPDAADRLIGLGPGLTPAGDDLVAGYTLTLTRAGRAVDLLGRPGLLASLDPQRTTLISRHLLRWAEQGVAGEQALALTDSLLTATGSEALAPLPSVLAHGATSGSDWAAGVLLALTRLT